MAAAPVVVEPTFPTSLDLDSLYPSNPSMTLTSLPPSVMRKHTNTHSHLIFISLVAVLGTLICLSLACLLLYLIRRRHRRKSEQLQIHGRPHDIEPNAGRPCLYADSTTTLKKFSLWDIKNATDHFSSMIGKGGFGPVYKARFDDGLVAAVKRTSTVWRQHEQEPCKEMEFLGRLCHHRLVSLKGFCITKTERFLVYEFMENGSLNEYLQTSHIRTTLDWRTRTQIAIDIATALVAYFGLGNAIPKGHYKMDQVSIDLRGSRGYLDPEYGGVTRQLTVKSDIYGYGVVLLELLTGRPALLKNRIPLLTWVQPYWATLETGAKLAALVDPALQERYEEEELWSLCRLARLCTHKDAALRPDILQVLAFLHHHLLGHHSSSSNYPISPLPSKPFRYPI